MKPRLLVTAAIGLLALLLPAAGLAKGASEATISGPGLGDGITLAGEGRPGGDQLMQIAQDGGFFSAVFLTTPNPMLAERPAGTLGPKYAIVYTMPGPNGESDQIRQDVYPYATPEPLTYVEPGQGFFTTETTVGGWYVAGSILRDDLVAVGLPETPPAAPEQDTEPWRIVVVVTALMALGAAVIALVRRSRPRSGPEPA